MSLAFKKVAQQSVQPTGGILRGLQAFFWLRAFSALGVLSRPTHQRLTQTVGRTAFLLSLWFFSFRNGGIPILYFVLRFLANTFPSSFIYHSVKFYSLSMFEVGCVRLRKLCHFSKPKFQVSEDFEWSHQFSLARSSFDFVRLADYVYFRWHWFFRISSSFFGSELFLCKARFLLGRHFCFVKVLFGCHLFW